MYVYVCICMYVCLYDEAYLEVVLESEVAVRQGQKECNHVHVMVSNRQMHASATLVVGKVDEGW